MPVWKYSEFTLNKRFSPKLKVFNYSNIQLNVFPPNFPCVDALELGKILIK